MRRALATWIRGAGGPTGRALLLLAVCLAGGAADPVAQTGEPSPEALQELQERGRLIALSLIAEERAAALLKSRGSAAPPSDRQVVIPGAGGSGWRVIYLQDTGKETPAGGDARKAPAIVAETTFSPDAAEVGALGMIVPPKIAPAAVQSYARALDEAESATAAREDCGRPLLDMVVREKDLTFSVYVISQKPEDPHPPAGPAGQVVIGRDFLVRVAATGRQVLSVERLHETAATLSLEPRAAGAPVLHQHDKGDLPSPTDVALVLLHPVLSPLLVLTPQFMYRIDREGGVTWLGNNPAPRSPAAPAPSPGPAPGGGR